MRDRGTGRMRQVNCTESGVVRVVSCERFSRPGRPVLTVGDHPKRSVNWGGEEEKTTI